MPGKRKVAKRSPVLPLIAVAIVIVAVFIFTNLRSYQPPYGASVQAGGYSYNVLLALNQSEWVQGLMNYTFQCSTPGACVNGMLFVFPYNGTECFWMKNTPQPLLQAWISGNTITEAYYGKPENTSTVCAYGNEVLELYS